MLESKILGTGAYLPEKILSNFDLEKMIDTNNEWIVERTGISERRIASPQEQTSDLAFEASKKALEASGLKATDIDFIFLATTTSDQIMPSTACTLQDKLGASKDCGALDISAACTGFIYGLSIADQMIKSGLYKNILIVGAEILSRFVDYKDRETCILFGDGAGAFVLSATEEPESSSSISSSISSNSSSSKSKSNKSNKSSKSSKSNKSSKSKILGHTLKTDGELGHLLSLKIGGTRYPGSIEALEQGHQYVKIKGRDVFKNATRFMASCCDTVLKQTNFELQNIDWLIPHQANLRIIESLAKQFDFSIDKVVLNISKTGNNASATIPIAMDLAIRDGRIKRGQHILLTAFGGGLTAGSLLMRY